jgi:hypothetical protein
MCFYRRAVLNADWMIWYGDEIKFWIAIETTQEFKKYIKQIYSSKNK